MNIFVLDLDPTLAAQMQCDKHVVKMPLECAQMLSTAHRELDTFPSSIAHDSSIYRSTHKHHPCNRWLRQSAANYHWLYDHFEALCAEYSYRYYKLHMSWFKLSAALKSPPSRIPDCEMTPFAQAMPDEYKHDDPVVAYRRFYIADKRDFLDYRKRQRPAWLEDAIDECVY